MMKRKTAVIFGIIIAAQLCLTPYAGVKVQAAELEEGQMFEDSSEDSETFGDVSIPDTQSAEKTEENEFGDDDGFSDGDVETFSAEDADQFRENMQELVLNVQDGEDITVKLNTLLAQARDKATDEKQCKVIVPPGNYTLTGTLHMYSNIYLYAEGATITKTSPRKEILLRLGDTKKSAGGYEGYRNITIDGGTWDSNYECVEDKEGPGGFVGFRIGHATNVTVKNVIPKHLEATTAKLEEIGCEVEEFGDAVRVRASKRLHRTHVKTLPYPGYPTDMQPQIAVTLALAEGTSIVTESIFENRFKYADELSRMGANIKVEGNSAIIDGVRKLTGARVSAPDLRAGAALVIAGLAADGITVVDDIVYIQRGYERFEEKLRSLGGIIEKVSSEKEIQKFRLKVG